jgi:aminoglycoside phosphotransferase (APT) family kinase protein
VSQARVDEYRELLDSMPDPQPVLEWGLRWLERHLPTSDEVVLVHSDFRTGNILIEDGHIAAILDWEFARFGDPHEDLGWFLAKCWRFGAVEREAGGIGSRGAFLEAYEAGSGRKVDRDAVRWWEVMATTRWAVIALLQAERHRSGRERSLELALTAHIVPPLELDVIELIDGIAGKAVS